MAMTESLPSGNLDGSEDQAAVGFEHDGEVEEAFCGGCHRLIGEDSVDEGVIQFATKLWHVDCFRCAKCNNKVSTDRDDILLLSDGHPICGECNYSCNICNLPIMEEAIMTGDESYHASCFTCRSCHSKIEELVFAKTSQGIYCMPCHNERVARSRKHAEQRRAKLKKEKQRLEAEEALKTSSAQDSDLFRSPGASIAPSRDSPAQGLSPGMPTIAVDVGQQRSSENRPPSPPAKETTTVRAPANAVQPTASGSSSSLSPWPGAGSQGSSHRPGSANGKRPMQAPPPPIREPRVSPGSRSAQSNDVQRKSPSSPGARRSNDNLADELISSSSTASLRTAVPGPQDRTTSRSPPLERGEAVSRSTSHNNKADDSASRFGGSSESNGQEYESTRSALALDSGTDAATVDPSEAGQSSSGLDYSQGTRKLAPMVQEARNPSGSQISGLHSSPGKSRKQVGGSAFLTASGSSTRMSKAFSFYDPDFIQLMDSFGRFDSNENLQLSSPMLEDDGQGNLDLAPPTVPKTSKAAKRMSMRPPARIAEEADETDPDQFQQDLDAPLSAPSRGPTSDTEEEALQEERADPGLSRLSAKMRASMQQAKDGHVSMDISFVEKVLKDLDETREKMHALQVSYDRIKRASQQAAQGFSMAKEEFENEVNARHDAEMEMAKLRRQLVDQAFKLATMSSEKRQQEQLERRSQDIRASLKGMERDLTKLTVERDLTVAEVAELLALQDGRVLPKDSNAIGAVPQGKAQDSMIVDNFAKRLDAVKAKYRQEIDDLSLERDSLLIEIEELKHSRELFLEEAQSLNAKNEELNLLFSQMTRRIEKASQTRDQLPALPRMAKDLPPSQHSASHSKATGSFGFGFGKPSKQHTVSSSIASTNESLGLSQSQHPDVGSSIDSAVQKVVKPEKIEPAPMAKKFKWMKPKLNEQMKHGGSSTSNGSGGTLPPVPPKISAPSPLPAATVAAVTRNASHDMVVREHLFQPFNVLRPTRCIACQKNMWGQSEMRCAICSQVCHSKCLQSLSLSCNQPYTRPEDAAQEGPTGPSMFGKDLVEQAEAESRDIPIVVEKCIQAVEAFGMDYEGIYRKSGGSSQLKVITQLFERGSAFDLADADRFNDVSAITSVLKNYFRELPVPLLTFDLHEDFIRLSEAKLDASSKRHQMGELIAKLPRHHFATLKCLVLHLHRVQQRSEENRMNSRNLGVVFGPTLMKSGDPTQEFAHMGGKAMTIEYFIEHAEELFA